MTYFLMAAAIALVAAPTAASACTHEVQTTEKAADGRSYTLRARSSGADCTTANIELALLGPAGAPVFQMQRKPADMAMLFPEKPSATEMQAGLGEWAGGILKHVSTSQLPGWAADGWMKSADISFAFQPEGLSRADYEALRKAARPMLCVQQGSESFACVLPDGDAPARQIGLYIFDR